MNKLAVIYHSGRGHTAHIAAHVAEGAGSVPDTEVHVLKAENLARAPAWQHRGVPYDEAINRLGSWSGMMAQAGHGAPADSFVAGDIKTARLFGRNFSETLHRVSSAVPT